MHDPRSFRAPVRLMIIGMTIALVAACTGTAAGPSAAAPTQTAAAPSVAGPVGAASPDGGTATDTPGGGSGGSAGDRTKGSLRAQVTGGLTETLDLPFAAGLSLWESGGPGSAYLPFTDSDAVIFITLAGGAILVQYAKSSTGVGLTSGATPCTLNVDVLDGSTAKASFTCMGMTLIQGQAVGTADLSGTFEAHK